MKATKNVSQKLFMAFLSWLFYISSFPAIIAQVEKSVQVSTPGTLATQLTNPEQELVTHLTVIGNIDARDVKFVRDSLPLLEEVDMKRVKIASYEGNEQGTAPDWYSDPQYPANVLPLYSFEKKGLKKIVLPDSILKIDQHAFQSCKILEQIIVGNYLQEIETEAFISCYKLTSINMPDSLKIIGENVFFNCTSIVELVIPAYVNTIKNGAFGSGFKGELRVNDNNPDFLSIDGVIFKKDTSELVSSPALYGSYIVPEPVSTIGDYSFYYNSVIESITFPKTLKSIGARVFDGNSNIKAIVFSTDIPPTVGWLSLRQINTETCVLYVPEGTVETYKGANGWSDFKNILEVGIITRIKEFQRTSMYVSGGFLHLKNAQPGSMIEIYSLQGILLNRLAVGHTNSVPIPKGAFLVKTESGVTKFLNL